MIGDFNCSKTGYFTGVLTDASTLNALASVNITSDCTVTGIVYGNNIKARTFIGYQNQILTNSIRNLKKI